MKTIILILLIFSCSPMFISDQALNDIWIGKNYNEITNIIGPFDKQIEDLSQPGNTILIWEASKANILIPVEELGAKKNKLGTSISSLHVYIDKNKKIISIKKSLY